MNLGACVSCGAPSCRRTPGGWGSSRLDTRRRGGGPCTLSTDAGWGMLYLAAARDMYASQLVLPLPGRRQRTGSYNWVCRTGLGPKYFFFSARRYLQPAAFAMSMTQWHLRDWQPAITRAPYPRRNRCERTPASGKSGSVSVVSSAADAASHQTFDSC